MTILISGTLITLALLALANFLEVKFNAFQDAGLMKKILIYLGNSVLSSLAMAILGAALGAGVGDESAGDAVIFLFLAGLGIGFVLGLIFTGAWQYFAG